MTDKPLVVSLREQPVLPGSFRQIPIDWVVPDGWATEVLRVDPGTPVPLTLSLTTIDEGVVAGLSGSVTLRGECVRCLKPLEIAHVIEASEVFAYPEFAGSHRTGGAESVETEGDDLDEALEIVRESIDIEPVLRDAIFGEAPLRPVCSDGCLGICEHCGVLLADAEPGHKHEFLDPRFAALAGFFDAEGPGPEVDAPGGGDPA